MKLTVKQIDALRRLASAPNGQLESSANRGAGIQGNIARALVKHRFATAFYQERVPGSGTRYPFVVITGLGRGALAILDAVTL